MSLPLKVLWSAGLTLGPQQLQQTDRYHEARLQQLAMTINPYLWGVRAADWNLDALSNNVLQANALSLLFQDGEIYDAPFSEPPPEPVDLSDLSPEDTHFTYYAALPIVNPHGGNMDAGSRYVPAHAETTDLFSNTIPVDVAYLKKNVTLLPPTAARTAYLSFPVVRIRRAAAGGFELDGAFMPPTVALGVSNGLAALLDALLGKLNAKITALQERHRQNARQAFEVHNGDLSSFWMLNVICSAAAPLTHCARYRQHHPEHVFDKLTALAGGLMTFSPRYALADLPTYRHDDPWPAFMALNAIIRDLIDTVISSRYLQLPLRNDEEKTTHYHAVLDPARIDRRTVLCLAVNADMPAIELVAAVPLRFKMASPDAVERLVGIALPGVELVHMAQVPTEVPVRPNTYYFSVEPKGQLYEDMLKAQAMTVYAPGGMKGLRLELFAILP
ncbi:type VI secretion system protein ImpJ [Pseudoduganella lurida]|uniref:Type VI secretion system protein ImpJ n=1 Tax=Pseudoduganella lurida TaxID=1036180 RepID=A0A562QXL9_9BURK|nr:type VI secretion system baseplate subunit TssK [Pseudoduganella lurida]TWI60950.1 type VI secretion system protein ImpJ [Pseudoduganella lurida]